MTDWIFSSIFSSSLSTSFLLILYFVFIEVIVNIALTTSINKMNIFCIYLGCTVFITVYKGVYIKDKLYEKEKIDFKNDYFLTSYIKFIISNHNRTTLNNKLQLAKKNAILYNILFRIDNNQKLEEIFHVSSINDLNLINDFLSCLVL